MSALGDKALQIAQDLIACESVTPEDAGALDVLIGALKPARFTFWRLNFKDEDTPPVDNLYARFGDGPPHLCFAGHVDVVPPGDSALWRHPPFAAEISDGVLYGRGASDMKGAIACFTAAALDYIKSRGRELDGSISFLITGDEEGPAINGTSKVLAWMKEQGERLDHCIVGEPTNAKRIGEALKIGRRGSLNGILRVTGVQGHVAYPHRATNPIPPLARVIAALDSLHLDDGTEQFPPSNLEFTGIETPTHASNVIPGSATAQLNIRFNNLQRGADLVQLVEQIAEREAPGSKVKARISGEAFLTPPGPLYDVVVAAIEEETGLAPELSTSGGTSDGRFLIQLCPVVDFGLPNATMHKVGECAAVDDIQALSRIYERIVRKVVS